jgi:hypothetical protein
MSIYVPEDIQLSLQTADDLPFGIMTLMLLAYSVAERYLDIGFIGEDWGL